MRAGSELSGGLGRALRLVELGLDHWCDGAAVGTKLTAWWCSEEGICRRSARTVEKMPPNGARGTRTSGVGERCWAERPMGVPCGAPVHAVEDGLNLAGRSKSHDAEPEAKPFETNRRWRPNDSS